MARGVNKAIVIGHICNDPVKKLTTTIAYIKLIIATNDKEFDYELNEFVDVTDKHTVIVKNKLADTLEPMLKKGQKIYAEGKNKVLSAPIKNTRYVQKFPQIEAYRLEIL